MLKRILCTGLLLAVVFPVWVQANYLVTLKEAPIRADSLSSSDVIDRIPGGTNLMLLDESRMYGTGYWKVKLPSGETGFVYKTHVRLKEGVMPGSTGEGAPNGGGLLEVHMINVGQGDAALIICPDGKHQLVIDSGDLNSGFRYPGSGTEFKNYIQSYLNPGDAIEVAIASHPHSDHIGNMKWLVQNYNVLSYVDNGRIYDSGTYRSLEKALTDKGTHRERVTDTVLPDVDFCTRLDVTARVLRPEGFNDPGMDDNDYSVIVRIDYGSSSFLFTGDAEHLMEQRLLDDPSTNGYLDVDWLKVGHHGSHSSSTSEFLRTVTPDIAVISSGGENVYTNKGYLHPRQQTLDSLFMLVGDRTGISTTLEGYDKPNEQWIQTVTKKAVYITNNEGDLVFLTNGSNIWRKGDKISQ